MVAKCRQMMQRPTDILSHMDIGARKIELWFLPIPSRAKGKLNYCLSHSVQAVVYFQSKKARSKKKKLPVFREKRN